MSSLPADGSRRQNPRDFTVKICRATTGDVVGTGIVVTLDGKIVTCRHVVEDAGVNVRTRKPIRGVWALVWDSIAGLWRRPVAENAPGEVWVYFPSLHPREPRPRRAHVAGCFADHADDVVLLQLVDGPALLDSSHLPVLGTAADSHGQEFETFGYRRLADYLGLPGEGRIVNFADPPAGKALLAHPIMVQSEHIDSGMSGAAVLDKKRNLVVGIIAQTADLAGSRRIADRHTGFAVDAAVLRLSPFQLPVQEEPHPLERGPQPRTDVPAARAKAELQPGYSLNGAPAVVGEWVGRADLLLALNEDWDSGARRVSGLIGFGGEGKSSLARQWLHALRAAPSRPQPAGVFWWGFYDRPEVDEFFEAALAYMGGGRIDPRKLPAASLRAQVVGAMLGAGRYLFILDGLEVLQHEEGDQYGLLTSTALREFLELFAASDHRSLCLVTSRAPLSDIQPYATYIGRDVGRLSAGDGRALLRNLGVRGPDEALDQVVAAWDGHALTLSLLGGYLAELHGGDVARLADIPSPTADEPRYERVRGALLRYDDQLTAAERAFLKVFSAFRMPVEETALPAVFGAETDGAAPPGTLFTDLANADIEALVRSLLRYHILRHDPGAHCYTLHPLVRDYYYAGLSKDPASTEAVHQRIGSYYLARAMAIAEPPLSTLADLIPAIEALHHACRAGAYQEGFAILLGQLYRGQQQYIAHTLGAFETLLAVLPEFFPSQDVSQDPGVSPLIERYFIVHELGLTLMNVGRLREALPFFERAIAFALHIPDWGNVATAYENMAGVHSYLGAIAASAEAAGAARDYARQADSWETERNSLAGMAWAAHLGGDLKNAALFFQEAEALEQARGGLPHLVFLNGVRYADHLLRVGNTDYARRIAETNLRICALTHFTPMQCAALRALADVDAAAERHDAAQEHYALAVTLARGVARRDFLISALLASGRWQARRGQTDAARAALSEALEYAHASGFRIHEADIRIGLAWAARAVNDTATAQTEAERARRLSVDVGYYWGQLDAEEILGGRE